MLKTYVAVVIFRLSSLALFMSTMRSVVNVGGWRRKPYFTIDTFVISRSNKLCSTEPSRYHALSQQRGLSEKKSIIAPPDMGLEPMTLRLNV